jgi:glycosyltransferase involved in cell wall biosynthesis
MGKRRILFLIPSLASGGAERTLINLLNKIDLDIYDVDLVAVLGKGPYLDQIPSGVRFIALFKNDFLVRVLAYLQKKIAFDLVFRLAVKLKIRDRYDVSICFLDSNFTDLLFFIPKSGMRYTWVHSSYKTYRNFYKFYENERYRNKLIKKRYGRLDGIFFVSEDSKKEFIEVFGEFPLMEVVYNMIDREMVLSKSREVISFAPSVFSFVAVGSLFPVKGFDRLIRSAGILKSRGYEFAVYILGKGMEEAKLKQLVIDLGLEKNIFLLGFSHNPYPYMKTGNVFVMSSVSEALPTVLCEAMILEKPVVVTNCSGCRELVDEERYGLMAEQEDESLAEKMAQYLQQEDLVKHYARKSGERADIFDTEKVIQTYYKFFNS